MNTNRLKSATIGLLALGGSLLGGSLANAQPYIYTAGHGDFGVAFEDGSFVPHWHLGGAAIVDGSPLGGTGEEFAPADIRAQTTATVVIGSVSNTPAQVATWLNVSAGSTVYRLGNSAYEPNLGFSTEELSPGDWLPISEFWDDASIGIKLTGWNVNNPGNVAIYDPSFASYGPWFATNGSMISDNTWEFSVGGHEHLAWAFSDAGYYELTFEFSGLYIGEGSTDPINGQLITQSATFGFYAGSAIPEPSTYAALVGGAVLGLTVFKRRRR